MTEVTPEPIEDDGEEHGGLFESEGDEGKEDDGA